MGTGRVIIGVVGVLLAAGTVAGLRGRGKALRWCLALATIGSSVAAAILLAALLRPDFSLEYVHGHVSLDLPVPYRIAAFWAGQEGTILLWSLLLQIAAQAVLVATPEAASRRRLAAGLLTGLATMMWALLLIRSPFELVDMTHGLPADGLGLNPLLRNPWMIAHPPMLFLGYALLAVPCVMAVAATWQRQPEQWIADSRGWLLAAWAALGTGMMLGAYWAYVTLGWGGFWAWDPVENSSLVPWLYATALIHGARVQLRNGAFARANYVLALTGLLTVLYGSYLTRSGVLGDFSVHSFAGLGTDFSTAWVVLMAVPVIVSAAVLLNRREQVQTVELPTASNNMATAVWVLIGMATLVLIGMSAPLLTRLLGEAQAVQQSFYNRTQTVMFLFCAGLLYAIFRPQRQAQQVLSAALTGLAAALVVQTIQPEYVGGTRVGLILLGGSCGLVIAVCMSRLGDGLAQRRWPGVGAAVAHIGIALLTLGAVLSGPGERTEVTSLIPGQPKHSAAVGSEVELVRITTTPNNRQRLELRVGQQLGAAEIYDTARMGLMRHPAVYHRLSGDIYIEPEELLSGHSHGEELHLKKAASGTAAGLKITFEAFEMGSGHGSESAMSVGARLQVDDGSGPQTVTPEFVVGPEGNDSPPVLVGGKSLRLLQVMAGDGAVLLSVSGPDEAATLQQQLTVRITWKPWIWLVWLGSIATVAGGLIAIAGRPGGR